MLLLPLQTSYRKADSTPMESWIHRAKLGSTGLRQERLLPPMSTSPGTWWLLWHMMLGVQWRAAYRVLRPGVTKLPGKDLGFPSIPALGAHSHLFASCAMCMTVSGHALHQQHLSYICQIPCSLPALLSKSYPTSAQKSMFRASIHACMQEGCQGVFHLGGMCPEVPSQ